MGKNIKQQFIHAIDQNFNEGMDKHSIKAQDLSDGTKIFSYADRKNLLDVACNFANFLRENGYNVKLVKNINAEHIQSFLNCKAETCSSATLQQYANKFSKLENLVNKTYNINANFKGYTVPLGKENTKIRNTCMSVQDFQKLENYFSRCSTSAKTAIQLTARVGLRVSECVKLQGRDIDLKNNIIHVQDGKGGRSRDVPIRVEDKAYFADLKANTADMERVCPVRPDSINKALNRALNAIELKSKYKDTGIHCIRKMYAQREFGRCRAEGKPIKQSLGEVSVLLGHGKDRLELMQQYVLNIT